MTVIGVGRDITWFLVSSPAVMRKNDFPDAITHCDGHRPGRHGLHGDTGLERDHTGWRPKTKHSTVGIGEAAQRQE